MNELPDGSSCFTATIMSREEAMALPLKDRPLNYRISSEMYHAVFESVGAASMCWNPKPTNEVFDASAAAKIAADLCLRIADEIERKNSVVSIKQRNQANNQRNQMHSTEAISELERPQGTKSPNHPTQGMGCDRMSGRDVLRRRLRDAMRHAEQLQILEGMLPARMTQEQDQAIYDLFNV